MPSVLAIVSKAVFDDQYDGAIGDILGIDRYVSKLPVFKKLGKGDAIFLVTVRPGNVLWRIAVIEGAKKKGKAWVGKKNKTPVADASSVVDALKFESGNGVGAAKNALGMALQTPRRLTAGDVALLRGLGAATPAVVAYRGAVDETPAAARAREQAAAVGESTLELVNRRLPFRMLRKLPKPQLAQLSDLTARNRAGEPRDCIEDENWAPMELVDVRDKASGAITHQLYVWPWGSGALFENDSPVQLAAVIQHAYQMNEGDLALRRALAAAYSAAPLSELIDFRLDEVRKPPEIVPEPERPKGILDEIVLDEIVGDVPAWERVKKGQLEPILAAFDAEKIASMVLEVCTHDDAHNLFEMGLKWEKGEIASTQQVEAMLRTLAELVDRSNTDAAIAFAERAEETLAKGAQFWLAAIASLALAARARRLNEPFPVRFHPLAIKSDFLGNGIMLGSSMRDVIETVPAGDREAFLEQYCPGIDTREFEEIKNNREYEKPCLVGRWWFVDLVPTERTAELIAADLASWDDEPKPVKEALAIIEKLGAICAPHLRAALEEADEPHPALKKALALVEPKSTKKKMK